LKQFLVLGEQPHALESGKGLLDVAQKLLRRTVEPDARTEFRVVREANLEGTAFTIILGELLLYLVDDRYIGNGGTLRAVPFLALMILEGLIFVNAPVRHDLELVGQRLISEKEFLERALRWARYEALVGTDVGRARRDRLDEYVRTRKKRVPDSYVALDPTRVRGKNSRGTRRLDVT